jgi:FkbM family methyltransferase
MELIIKRHPLLRQALAGPRAIRRAWIGWRGQSGDAILQRMSEIVKDKIVFEAKEFGGVFSINPRSHLLHRFLRTGSYEPSVSQLFLSLVRPERDIIDVGANIGFFTVAGAKKLTTGRLLAAEPTAGAFGHLSENVTRNEIADKVILFNGMIGAAKGQATIHFVPGLEEYSSMNNPEHFATRGKEIRTNTVPVERVDDLVERYGLRPAVMKVDVEGGEFSVFSGAQRTLSTYRPAVISEIWCKPTKADGHSGAELVRMFEKIDYVVRNPNDPGARPGLDLVGEIICIPKEQYDPSLLFGKNWLKPT